jgi:hypothetical protein
VSRWITITADHLKAAGHGALIDKARTVAVGSLDPVQQAIDTATARVRRAVASGNALDADASKVPASFEGVTVNLALFALHARIGLPLSDDQKQTQRDITGDLNRTSDDKRKVEVPDDAATEPTMQATGIKAEAINVPRRQTGRDKLSGL